MALPVCSVTNGRKRRVLKALKKLSRFGFRLWSYLPVLWRDEDYDYMFFLSLIKHKIKRMREHMSYCCTYHPGHNQIKRMRIVELLINRLEKGDYCRYEHDQWYDHERGNDEKFRAIAMQALHQEDQDWNMVFDIIKRHAQRWWD